MANTIKKFFRRKLDKFNENVWKKIEEEVGNRLNQLSGGEGGKLQLGEEKIGKIKKYIEEKVKLEMKIAGFEQKGTIQIIKSFLKDKIVVEADNENA